MAFNSCNYNTSLLGLTTIYLFELCSLYQARAGLTSTVDALKIAEAFVNEDNFTVWSDLSCNLSTLSVMIQHTDYYPQYKAFILKLFGKKAREIGRDIKKDEGS